MRAAYTIFCICCLIGALIAATHREEFSKRTVIIKHNTECYLTLRNQGNSEHNVPCVVEGFNVKVSMK